MKKLIYVLFFSMLSNILIGQTLTNLRNIISHSSDTYYIDNILIPIEYEQINSYIYAVGYNKFTKYAIKWITIVDKNTLTFHTSDAMEFQKYKNAIDNMSNNPTHISNDNMVEIDGFSYMYYKSYDNGTTYVVYIENTHVILTEIENELLRIKQQQYIKDSINNEIVIRDSVTFMNCNAILQQTKHYPTEFVEYLYENIPFDLDNEFLKDVLINSFDNDILNISHQSYILYDSCIPTIQIRYDENIGYVIDSVIRNIPKRIITYHVGEYQLLMDSTNTTIKMRKFDQFADCEFINSNIYGKYQYSTHYYNIVQNNKSLLLDSTITVYNASHIFRNIPTLCKMQSIFIPGGGRYSFNKNKSNSVIYGLIQVGIPIITYFTLREYLIPTLANQNIEFENKTNQLNNYKLAFGVSISIFGIMHIANVINVFKASNQNKSFFNN